MFMKEYKWAHRICNQVKSDDKFIKKAGDEWIADEAAITKYLNDLLGTKT